MTWWGVFPSTPPTLHHHHQPHGDSEAMTTDAPIWEETTLYHPPCAYINCRQQWLAVVYYL